MKNIAILFDIIFPGDPSIATTRCLGSGLYLTMCEQVSSLDHLCVTAALSGTEYSGE